MAKHHRQIREHLFELGFIAFTLKGILRLGKLKNPSNDPFTLTTKLWECPAMQDLKGCLRYAKGA